jgi:hypothetical protein
MLTLFELSLRFRKHVALRAIQTYSVGSRKMLMTRAAIRPPTVTMAKGGCE